MTEDPGTARVITLLVVDDHPVVRDGLRGMFASAPGFEVLGEAADGAEALAAVAEASPDLVLADLTMPRLDGKALLERLPAGLPAIVITGRDEPPPPRAAALLRKDELTRERLAFAIRHVMRGTR